MRIYGVRFFFFSSRRRHTRCLSAWSSDVCSSDLQERGSPWAEPGRFEDVVHGERQLDYAQVRPKVTPVLGQDSNQFFANLFRKKRSEERRVGKEGRSRGSPYH